MSNPSKRWLFTLLGLALVVTLVLSYGGEDRYPLMVISGPTDLRSFEIGVEEGETLWSIAAEEPRTLRQIEYGTVPVGFRQVVPADIEPPRALIAGESLKVEIVSREGTFYHQGLATSPETFQSTKSRMVLRGSDPTLPD
jgi:hypothetical protein